MKKRCIHVVIFSIIHSFPPSPQQTHLMKITTKKPKNQSSCWLIFLLLIYMKILSDSILHVYAYSAKPDYKTDKKHTHDRKHWRGFFKFGVKKHICCIFYNKIKFYFIVYWYNYEDKFEIKI